MVKRTEVRTVFGLGRQGGEGDEEGCVVPGF